MGEFSDFNFIPRIVLGLFVLFFLALLLWTWQKSQPKRKPQVRPALRKHHGNPVLAPPPHSEWEAIGTLNPAAVHDDDGRVHIVYRAIGADGQSRFGYAVSEDGINFDERSPYPIFAMENPRAGRLKRFDPVMYPSGGSWGGAEDPRLVKIDGKIYMTFNAFDGWDFIRMAVSSIKEEDFFMRRFKWSRPIFISASGTISKNWVLFPEKVNGKFAIIHSIVPEVLIEYVDNLDHLTKPITSPRKPGMQPGRKDYWDNWIRGAGPPPIKTERGWLLLYHATTEGDSRYKLGALLLDLENPTRVLGRSNEPLLLPEEWYENEWKPGIIYASGALIREKDLYVYYGGGDKHVCVAHAPLEKVFNLLVS